MAKKSECKCVTVVHPNGVKRYKRQLCWGSWKTMGGGKGGGIVSNKSCKK